MRENGPEEKERLVWRTKETFKSRKERVEKKEKEKEEKVKEYGVQLGMV